MTAKTWRDIARPLIKHWEHCELKAYPDPVRPGGLPITIGWGATTDIRGNKISLGTVWTQAQADERLEAHITEFGKAFDRAVTQRCYNANVKGACVSLIHNIGSGAFANSTLARLLNEGKTMDAANQFPRWNKSAGKVVRGLTNRRAMERRVFLGESS